ncbi:MAG: FG-GAP-like repeat-containing protein [Gemmatales bacterium]
MFRARQPQKQPHQNRASQLRSYRPSLEVLEDRTTPASVNFAVVGDYGAASSALNLGNIVVGAFDPEGNVASLVHQWNPDFLVAVGDNNYLCGEQFDANLLLDMQLGIALGKIPPSTAQGLLNDIANFPFGNFDLTLNGDTTLGSNVITGLSSTTSLAVGMVVFGTGIQFPTGPSSPFLPTITQINSDTSVTISQPATATGSKAPITFMLSNINLGLVDGLSHIDRNIGRYYSDFIYPYVTSSTSGQFGNGSPTGTNRMFPVPGNHDWADPLSDGGTSLTDKELCLPVEGVETTATLVTPGTLTVADASNLRVGMTVLGSGLPTFDPSSEGNLEASIFAAARISSINGNTITLNKLLPTSLTPNSTLVFLPIFESDSIFSGIAPGNLDAYLNYFTGLNPTNSPGLKLGTTIVNGVPVPLTQPYYYSYTVGTAVGGKPLIEFFAVDSEPSDPYLVNTAVDKTKPTVADVLTSDEGLWLKNAMLNSQAVWKIPYFHHSPYSSSSEPDEGPNGEWMRLPFQQWGASTVIYGHVHNYERFSLPDPNGGKVAIPYFVNGDGGAPITPFSSPEAGSQLRYNGGYGAMKVYADENHMTLQFVNTSGGVIDTFTIAQPLVTAGNNYGSQPFVKLLNATTGAVIQNIQAFETSFTGGVRVAMGDLNNDGMPDIVVAPGAGRTGQVKAYDGLTGQPLANFTPFTPYGTNYKNGLFVSVGNIDGLPGNEIIVSPQSGKLPVAAFTRTGATLSGFTPFYPYGINYTNGFTVATGNTNGGAADEIITAPVKGTSPVQVQSITGALLMSVKPYGNTFSAGIYVTAGDVNGDGLAEVIVGPVSGLQPARILNGQTGSLIKQITAFSNSYQSGIRLGVIDYNRDGKADLIFGETAPVPPASSSLMPSSPRR